MEQVGGFAWPEMDQSKKRKPAKEILLEKRKKVRNNLTLDLSKPQGTKQVRFDEIVLMKVGKRRSSKLVLLRGYSPSYSTFYEKCQQNKLIMHKRHQERKLTPKRIKIQQHVRDTLAKVNV